MEQKNQYNAPKERTGRPLGVDSRGEKGVRSAVGWPKVMDCSGKLGMLATRNKRYNAQFDIPTKSLLKSSQKGG